MPSHTKRKQRLIASALDRWINNEVLMPGDDFSETLHAVRTQHLHEKEVKRGFNTPTETGSFWVRGPGERSVERVSNEDSSWIEEYQTANFREPSDLGWKRPARSAEKLAATRVAMRFRSRRAARE